MPVPLFAAGVFTAAAAVAASTHDYNQGPDDTDEALPTSDDEQVEGLRNNNNSKKSVRFNPSSLSSIRAVAASERYTNNSVYHTDDGAFRLCRSFSSTTTNTYSYGFVNGDFSTGKMRDLELSSSCYNMAFHPERSTRLLAVGLRQGLCFYETTMYSLVHEISTKSMVSTMAWQQLSHSRNSCSLLAMGCLDGSVSLYRVDVDILESLGPTKLHTFCLEGEIRAMDCAWFGKLHPSLVVACGTKTGQVAFASYTYNDAEDVVEPVQATAEIVFSEPLNSSVLGLAIHPGLGQIAWSTKSGRIVVHKLRRNACMAIVLEEKQPIWSALRNGPVRCVVFSNSGHQLSFGGYDKTVVLVDTKIWAICREIRLQGTVNSIAFDPFERFLTIGSRDKTFRVFDASTYICIKTFHTQGWVTSISWGTASDENADDMVAVRSENKCISILNLSPIRHKPDIHLSSRHGENNSSLSWSRNGRLLARAWGSSIIVADSLEAFRDVARLELNGIVTKVVFCQVIGNEDLLATINVKGFLTLIRLNTVASKVVLEHVCSVMVEENLKALAWSPDGRLLATGGREHRIHIFSAPDLKAIREPLEMGGRVWDIDFVDTKEASCYMAVALGDYTAVIFNESFEPCLQLIRLRTVRCLSFHPSLPLLALGDGTGTIAIMDCAAEEIVHELCVNGRVNVVTYSPIGDFLLVGTDDCKFSFHETSGYQCLQQVDSSGFALVAAFSPVGTHVALGSAAESYTLLSLGPFLSIDLIPLTTDGGLEKLPRWVLNEALYRSGYGPSYVQRQMILGGSENLRRLAELLRQHPDALYAFNRKTHEGCFDTALHLKRPNLLKLAVTTLVDGTLDKSHDGQKSILTTDIPQRGRKALIGLIKKQPAEFIVSILEEMAFTKVPFTEPHSVEAQTRRLECGSSSFMDPWGAHLSADRYRPKMKALRIMKKEKDRSDITLTPAVLPLPGLGNLEFLSCLLQNAPPDALDNDAMALVLSVMWRNHIRKYFVADCIIFAVYFACWVALLEIEMQSSDSLSTTTRSNAVEISLSVIVIGLNSLYLMKEAIQSVFSHGLHYFQSFWNAADVLSIICIYGYILASFFGIAGHKLIPLAVVTTLLLTIKLLSYLRGFSDTGWLISVLIANFRDVRGFLVILLSILVGFAVVFRLLFGDTAESGFESLRRSFLSTFEMTILGQYDTNLLYEASYTVLAVLTFVLAVTCVLVVALNALISILADSYAKVQENSVANRRSERAYLIVEYMMLLPPRYLRKIETQTQWFHILVETDAEGDLVVHKDDWQGGINALRHDMEEQEERTRESHQKMIDQVKTDMDDLKNFRKEIISLLEGVSEDVKKIQKLQSEGGVTFSGKNVAKAVKAVKSIHVKGGSLFKLK